MESASKRKSHRRKRSKQPKAYIIGGHGEEGHGTFIVPRGCIIVVKAYSGSELYAYNPSQIGLYSLTPDILKDPITHYDKLHHSVGSIAIFREGDECPNFSYTLLNCYAINTRWVSCNSVGSGIMDVDLIYADKKHIEEITSSLNDRRKENRAKYEEAYQNPPSIYEYISQFYKYSVYPDSWSVSNLSMLKRNLPDALSVINKAYTITQEQLCSSYPGIYYNFVCRFTTIGNKIFTYNKNVGSSHIPPEFTLYNKTNTNTQTLLRKHITESILHRKPYIRSIYNKEYSVPPIATQLSVKQESSIRQGPSRATLRRRQQRRRQKQRRNKTIKNNK